MLIRALSEYIDGNILIGNSKYEISYRITRVRKAFIVSRHTYYADILLHLLLDEINFMEIAEHVKNDIEKQDRHVNRIICNWIVLSNRGGIYLYEAIASKENKKCGIMANHFMIINSEDGTVSFGPGHGENYDFCRMMKFLMENHRILPEIIWKNEFEKTMDHALEIIKSE
jgi:hypothetical protein